MNAAKGGLTRAFMLDTRSAAEQSSMGTFPCSHMPGMHPGLHIICDIAVDAAARTKLHQLKIQRLLVCIEFLLTSSKEFIVRSTLYCFLSNSDHGTMITMLISMMILAPPPHAVTKMYV